MCCTKSDTALDLPRRHPKYPPGPMWVNEVDDKGEIGDDPIIKELDDRTPTRLGARTALKQDGAVIRQ